MFVSMPGIKMQIHVEYAQALCATHTTRSALSVYMPIKGRKQLLLTEKKSITIID